MALVGDLGIVDLAQVFQVLAQNQKDGVLDVFRGDVHKGLRFRRGAITLQFDRGAYEERIVEWLRRLGRLTEEKLHVAESNRNGRSSSLVEVLVEMQLLNNDEVTAGVRERMAEELYELFSWTDARFEFHEGTKWLEVAGGEIDERLFFPADAVVMEAARRLDEWGEIRARVADDGEVFAPHVDQMTPDDDLQASVFEVVDGVRPVSEISKQIGRSLFETSKALARLVDKGCVGPIAPEEYPIKGREAFKAGRVTEAANLFDRATLAGVELPDVIREAGLAWEKFGEPAQAAERYVSYGDALVETAQTREALEAYRRARTLVCTHLEAWKRAVFLAVELASTQGEAATNGPEENGHALAEVLLEIGQEELAVEVLEKILARHLHDLAVKRALVNALERAGRPERLCEVYESIADDLAAGGDPVGAAASLQRVLLIRPERRDISGRIRELYRSDQKRRSRRRSVVVGLTSTALAAAVALLGIARERRASAELEALDPEPFLRVSDFIGAKSLFEEFEASHPLTFAAGRAKAEQQRIEELAQSARADGEKRVAEELGKRNRRIDEAAALTRKADELAKDSKLKEALSELRRALAVAPPDWEGAHHARQNASDLEAYMASSTALAAQAEQKLAANDLAGARQFVRDLMLRFPLSVEARVAKLPYLVRSTPEGATVEFDGTPLGTTPVVVKLPASKRQIDLNVRLTGYMPVKHTVEASSDEAIDVKLGRAPSAVLTLPSAASAPPAVLDGVVYVPLVSARVAAFGEGPDPRWVARVSTDGEILFTPVVEPGRVFVATTDGTVACLDPVDGHPVWRANVRSPVRVSLLRAPQGVFAAADDGSVRLFDAADGRLLREWGTGPRPSGGLVVTPQAIAIGTADRRIRLLDPNRGDADDRWIPFGAPVSGLAFRQDAILAAGDDGRIASFDSASGQKLFELPGGRIAWPRPVASGNRVLVDLEGRLAAVEPRTGRVIVKCAVTTEPAGAPVIAGAWVVLPLRDGTISCLRAEDLSVEWTWSGVSVVPSVGAAKGLIAGVAGSSLVRFETGQ